MTIKKRDLALQTVAELFLTAFNGTLAGHGALERVAAAESPFDPEAQWFRQTFTGAASFELFAGIPAKVAEALPGEDLAELLDLAFQALARSFETVAGSDISCGQLTEEASPQGLENIAYQLRQESIVGSVILSVPETLLTFLGSVIRTTDAAPPIHLDALMNVDLPVSISFGTTEMALADVLKLTTGSIVEFNHLLNEPVRVVVNDCLVAKGDVVVVDGNYGIRISEILASSRT